MDEEKTRQLEELEKASEEFNDLIENDTVVDEKNEHVEELEEKAEFEIKENADDIPKIEKKDFETEKKDELVFQDKKSKRDNKIFLMKTIPIILVLILMIGILAHLIFGNNKKDELKNSEPIAQNDGIKKKRNEIMNDRIIVVEDDEIQVVEEKKKTEEYKEYEKLTEEEKEEIEVIPRKEDVPYEVIDDIKEDIKYDDEKKIPEKFNLADVIDLKVENQGSFGLCWDFASLNALETNIALKHKEVYDFSEIHVDYMLSNLLYGFRAPHSGGNFQIFEGYFVNSGAVLGDTLEYRDYKDEEIKLFPSYSGKIKITETVDFPSVSTLDKDADNYEELLKGYRDVIKTHIMTNGSLYASISTSNFGNDGRNSYVDEPTMIDHAVSIVGWDDNYSKNNFKSNKGNVPEHDGAYIALNSWGDWWGNKGYFYISYDDVTVEMFLSGVVNTSLDTEGYVDVTRLKNKFIKDTIAPFVIEKNNKKYVSKLDLKNTNLYELSGKEITDDDLEFLNYFNIGYMNLSDNKITDLSKLDLKNVYCLNVSKNNIKSIDGIDFGRLYSLDVSDNPINSIDNVDFKDLEELNISGTNISDLSSLEKSKIINLIISNLKKLDVNTIPKKLSSLVAINSNIKALPSDLEIEDFLNLSSNPGIDLSTLPAEIPVIYLSKCEIEDLSNLSVKTTEMLFLDENNISDISKLKDVEITESLTLNNNPIEDLSSLKNPEALEEDYVYQIDVSKTKITDITNFNDLPFECIYATDNNIIDVSGYKGKQTYLNLSNNPLESDLSALKDVSLLVLNNVNLDKVVINTKMAATYLSLNNNNLEDLSFIENFDNLTGLSLQGNKKIPNKLVNSEITELNLSECDLTSFDVSGIPNLEYLNITDNINFDIKSIYETYSNTSAEANLYVVGANVEISYEDFKEKPFKNDKIQVGVLTLVIHTSGDSIVLNDYPELREGLSYYASMNEIENGIYNPETRSVKIIDPSKKEVLIPHLYAYNDLVSIEDVKVVFD